MTGTHVRIGQIAIDGVAHAPSAADLSRRVQTAIDQQFRLLRQAASARPRALPDLTPHTR